MNTRLIAQASDDHTPCLHRRIYQCLILKHVLTSYQINLKITAVLHKRLGRFERPVERKIENTK